MNAGAAPTAPPPRRRVALPSWLRRAAAWFVRWVRGSRIVLKQNAEYFGQTAKGEPVATGVDFRFVPDATTRVTDVTKDGENVVLKYAGNFQGNPFDAAVTLTPDGTDKLMVRFDVNRGQFSMSGTGVKN